MRAFLIIILVKGVMGGDLITITNAKSTAACCENTNIVNCNAVSINPAVLKTHETLSLPGGITMPFEGDVNGNPDSYSYGDGKGNEAVINYNPVSGGLNGHAMTAEGRSFAIENCGSEGHIWKEIDISNMQEGYEHSDIVHSDTLLANLTRVSDITTIVTYSVKIYHTARFAATTA